MFSASTIAPLVRPLLAGLLAMVLAASPSVSSAQTPRQVTAEETQPPTGLFVLNLRDADIKAVAEEVARITGRTMVLDPGVSGQVSVLSSKSMNQTEIWELFQSVLSVNGLAALPSGDLWRIVRQETVKEGGGLSVAGDNPGRLDVITRLVKLNSFPAATAAEAFRPLVASFGYIQAVPDTNTLIITDTAENVAKIEAIARTLDTGGAQDIYTIQVRNADAAEVATAVQAVLGVPQGASGPQITVDPRANMILLKSDAATHDMVLRIVADLDVKGRPQSSTVPVTVVYRLRFADATSLSGVLRGLVGQGGDVSNPVALSLNDAGNLEPAPTDGSQPDAPPQPQVQVYTPPPQTAAPPGEMITIEPVIETNAIVVRAKASVQSDIAALIQNLDQRRPQVLIEAAIVEVSGDISEELGIQLGFGKTTPPGGFAATSFSNSGPALQNILSLLGVKQAAALAPGGLSIGLARHDDYGILLQALGQSSKANLLSTPSITTLDNQPAEIIVGQNVPFRTGSFSTDGSGTNPFTTIERRDVGITMKVIPRVNSGDVIQLIVSQEVSSLTNTTVAGAADLVTNRRSITTTVLADNGGTIVLGGLISDNRTSVGNQVPGLSQLPIVGGLFRNRAEARHKQTLYVFLRPTILRNRTDVATVSNQRYQRLRSIEVDPDVTPPAPPTARPARQPLRTLPVEIDGLY
ncbi:MAG: type II secretion system secretin GspD [bacterium]